MTCPSESDLRQFLDDHAGPQGPAIETHLERCERCRQAAERLALDPTVLPPPAAAVATLPFLEQLKRTPPTAALSPGEPTRPVIPGYTLTRVIGRGGMGVVYEAVQESLGRTVAVKVLADGPFAPADLRERFRREGQVIARLHHPNVVQVIEVGEADGTPYLVLEYVAGLSLADHLTGTPWAPRRAAKLVQAVARAIESAHAHGVIHRDLKPANVLLDDGTPKVADFGLAGLRSDHAPAATSHSHRVLGTPEYAAPEQLAGTARQPVGPPADVYALGAILYELLTGRPPFSNANPVDTITQVLHADPIPPTRLEHGIPRDIETVCLKCLEKQPRRRYPTAGELADDLGRFLAGEPVQARPVGQLESAARWFRRHPVYLTLTLTAAVLVMVCGVFLTLLWQSAVRQSAVERQARLDADERAATEENARRSATRRLIESEIDLNLALCEQGEVTRGLDGLRAVLDRDDLPPELDRLIRLNLAGWRYRHATPLAELPLDKVASHLALTADGSLVVVAVGRELTVWEVQSGKRRCGPLTFRTAVAGVRVSQDGAVLAFGGRELTTCTPAPDGSFAVATDTLPADIADVAFAPAGDAFAVATADRRVRHAGKQWQVTAAPTSVCFRHAGDGLFVGTAGTVEAIAFDEPEPRVLAEVPAAVRRVSATRSGRHLAVALANDSIEVLDAATGRPASRTLDPRRPLRGMVLPPAADVLIGGFGEGPPHRRGECIVWTLPAGRRQQTLAFEGDVVDLVASADGSRLLAGGGHRWASLWMGQPWRPNPIRLGDAGFVKAVALDRDGLVAAVSHQPGPRQANPAQARTRLWQLPAEQRTGLHARFDGLFTLDAAANAPVLVAADRVGTVAAWNSTTGEPIGPPVKLPQRAWSVAVHPSGELALAVTNRGFHLLRPHTGRHDEYADPGATRNTDPKAVRFSASGGLFAVSAADHAVRVYHTARPHQPLHTLPHSEMVLSLHFSADDRRLVTCGMRGELAVWDVPAGRAVFRRATGRQGYAVAFAPDGRHVAYAGGDRTVSLLDADTGEPVGRPILTADIVNRLAWMPDERLLAAGIDGTARLYDAVTGRPIGPPFPVSAVGSAVSHTGESVFLGDADGGIRGWKVWQP